MAAGNANSGGAKSSKLVLGDDAIDSTTEDWFDYTASAHALGSQLYTISKSSGVCCGILGSWGSGKSSFMKLMREYVNKLDSKTCVTWFTAWDPGGIQGIGDAMLFRIFSDIAKEHTELTTPFERLKEALKLRKSFRRRVGEALGAASKVIPGTPGTVADVASELIVELEAPRNITDSFNDLVNWLEKNDSTVFLFVDDMDRTTGEEIRDLVSALKVYASRRRIVSVVGYDAEYVLNALKGALPPGTDSRKFLEKIITIRRTLPTPTDGQIAASGAALLQDLLGLEKEKCEYLGWYAPSLSSRNPRQLKTLLLSFSNLLSALGAYKKMSRDALGSALIISSADQLGVLDDLAVQNAFDNGDEEEIIGALRQEITKLPEKASIVEKVISAVETLEPDFVPEIITRLRLGYTSVEKYGGREERKAEAAIPSFDWRSTFSTLLTSAARVGFDLTEEFVIGSAKVTVPNSSRLASEQGKYAITIHEFEHQFNFSPQVTLSWEKHILPVFISSTYGRYQHYPSEMMIRGLFEMAPGLVVDGSCVVWLLDDLGRLNPPTVRRLIEDAKERSAGLRNSLEFEYTSSTKISSLVEYLLSLH